MFDVPPPLQSRGIGAYDKTWDLYFSWSRGQGVFDITEMNVTAGSEVAFVTADGAQYFFYANQKIAVVPATGGTPSCRSTRVGCADHALRCR